MGSDAEDRSCPWHEPDPSSVEAANAASLIVTSDCEAGIRRQRVAGGFTYRRDDGVGVAPAELARLEALRIPPAWTDVWISVAPNGHLQATGRDSRGRKQYRYHDRWRAARDETKYGKMVVFGESLPRIREAVDADLRRSALDRARVLALVVAILDATLIRVGNAHYLRENESYGLTTLLAEHAQVGSASVRFRFRGKSGKEREVGLDDRRIARALHRVRDLPGQELFQYVDAAGELRLVESGDVNGYLRETAGASITSKDFRTWGGSLAFALALRTAEGTPSEVIVSRAVREAAAVLGNTPAVCRRSYIHPALIDAYLAGALGDAWARAEADEPPRPRMRDEERAFLGLMRELKGYESAAAR